MKYRQYLHKITTERERYEKLKKQLEKIEYHYADGVGKFSLWVWESNRMIKKELILFFDKKRKFRSTKVGFKYFFEKERQRLYKLRRDLNVDD